MDSITLENFISFCDDMQIANEGFKDMEDIMQEAVNLSDKMRNNCKNVNDINEMIKLYDDYILGISRLRDILEETKISLNDRLKQGLGACVSALTIAGSLWLSVKASKISMGLITAIITGQIALVPTIITYSAINSKSSFLNTLSSYITAVRIERNILNKLKSLGCKNKKDTLSYTIEMSNGNDVIIYDKHGNIVYSKNEIATEGSIIQINKIFKDLKNNIEIIQKKIKDADGNPKEQIKYFTEYKEVLSDAEDAINQIPVGKLENPFTAFIMSMVPLFASVAVSIAWVNKSGSYNKPVEKLSDLKEISPMIAGAAGSLSIAVKQGSRKTCLNYIRESRKITNQIIVYLESESVKKVYGDVKDERDYQNKLLKNAKTENRKHVNKIVKTILTEVKPIIIKIASSKNVPLNFYSYDNELYVTAKNGNVRQLKSIVSSALKNITDKYKTDISKYNIEFNIEESDDTSVYIVYEYNF